jgi:hypothetical protein
MYKNALSRRNESANNDISIGKQMKLKRKNGLGSGYGLQIK